MREGEIITAIDSPDDYNWWWKGMDASGKVGIFPGAQVYSASLSSLTKKQLFTPHVAACVELQE